MTRIEKATKDLEAALVAQAGLGSEACTGDDCASCRAVARTNAAREELAKARASKVETGRALLAGVGACS